MERATTLEHPSVSFSCILLLVINSCSKCFVGFCVWSLFGYAVLSVVFSFTIISLLVALLLLGSCYCVAASIMCFFLMLPYINLQCEIVVFPVGSLLFARTNFSQRTRIRKNPLRSYLLAMIPYSGKIGFNIREPKSKINNQILQYLLAQTLGKHLHSAVLTTSTKIILRTRKCGPSQE